MTFAPELLLLSYALSRARMSSRPGPRPARRVAMSARHQYANQLGNR
jgi:hypothetical protein